MIRTGEVTNYVAINDRMVKVVSKNGCDKIGNDLKKDKALTPF